MHRATLHTTIAIAFVLVGASMVEAARWKVGTGPAGAQTRAAYPSGTCYWDTVDTGTNQCRYKVVSDGSCRWVQESGSDQCTPSSTPPPSTVGEYVRFEGSRAHLYSNDGTLQFDKYVDASGNVTLAWKQGSESVTLTRTSTGMTVTRNGVKVSVGTTATTAQMQTIASMLSNSVAVARFQLAAQTKLARAKARSATTVVTATARGVEVGYFVSNAFVDSLTGAESAFEDNAADPVPGPISGTSQKDCVADYEVAIWSYYSQYAACYQQAALQRPSWYYWFPIDVWGCAVEYGARAESAYFQMLACSAIPKL